MKTAIYRRPVRLFSPLVTSLHFLSMRDMAMKPPRQSTSIMTVKRGEKVGKAE